MILYLGKEEESSFVKTVLEEPIIFEEIGNMENINKLFNKAMEQAYNWIFIDMQNIYIDRNIIAEKILEVKNVNRYAKIIIVAKGYSPVSALVKTLEEGGFYNIITADLPGEEVKQLEEIIMGKNIPLIEQAIALDEESKPLIPKKVKIGVVGVCPRIGTTTQALQMLLYLQLCNKKVCYIEANANKFIESLENLYEDIEVDENLNLIKLNQIDFYKDIRKLPEILEMDYEYYIYDMGYIDSPTFNFTNYFEKDIQMIVGGFSTTELPFMMRLFENKLLSSKTNWIFSFIDENLKEEVKDSMEHFKENTYFAPYCCDPLFFNVNNQSIFEEIMKVKPEVIKKKKFGLNIFGRGK